MPYKDPVEGKEKHRLYMKKKYAENPSVQRARTAKNKARLYEWFREYKRGLSCVVCGENHPACLDFHHPDPSEKDWAPSRLVNDKGWSVDRLERALSKLVVLCANCHRKHHHSDVYEVQP